MKNMKNPKKKRSLKNWLFNNWYLIVLAAMWIFMWRGQGGFLLYVFATIIVVAVQIVLELSKIKKENKEKIKNLEKAGLIDMSRPAYFADSTEYNGGDIIELAKIITNNNQHAVSDIELLVNDYERFASEHKKWCETMYEGWTAGGFLRILNGFAYWLAGYDAVEDTEDIEQNLPASFGAYIDWKEEISEIISGLEEADKNLGYGLELDKIKCSGKEFGGEALKIISDYLAGKGFALVSLDTDSDCFHLFIVPAGKYEKLISLAKTAKFRFVDKF